METGLHRPIKILYFLPERFYIKRFLSLNKIFWKFDNIILAGDLKIDELTPCPDFLKNDLSDMKYIFNLTN